jgi:hypothetical protein
MEHIIEKNGIIYIFNRQNGENNDYFYEKCQFISQSQPKNIKEFSNQFINANIHCNKKYMQCNYK